MNNYSHSFSHLSMVSSAYCEKLRLRINWQWKESYQLYFNLHSIRWRIENTLEHLSRLNLINLSINGNTRLLHCAVCHATPRVSLRCCCWIAWTFSNTFLLDFNLKQAWNCTTFEEFIFWHFGWLFAFFFIHRSEILWGAWLSSEWEGLLWIYCCNFSNERLLHIAMKCKRLQ